MTDRYGIIPFHQHQIMTVMRRLRATCHPQERRALCQMLDGMCQDIGIDTPVLADLGRDAPLMPDMLDKFWGAVGLLAERGHEVNHFRKSSIIALHLPSLAKLLSIENLDVRIDDSNVHERLCGVTIERLPWADFIRR